MPEFVAQQLGHFVATSRWESTPQSVRDEARRALLNFIGCAIGVAHAEPIEAALRVLLPLSGADRVTLWGRGERLDLLGAAFINAIAGNLLDYDDTHLRTVIHPTAPVAPAALSLAEHRGLSGQASLHAFILGAEVECRIGNAVSPGHYARGWHITATCGVFGAAAAGAKLLNLTAQQTAHALGIAASQSSGLIENLPNAAKNVGVGNAARNGLFAALLAEQGYAAAPAAIEGAFGWARAMGDEPERRGNHQRSRQALGGSAEHLQTLPLRHRHARGHRCLPAAPPRPRAHRGGYRGHHHFRRSASP